MNPTRPSGIGRTIRFALLFGLCFALLMWLFDGAGPVSSLNRIIEGFTVFQTRAAGALLGAIGEPVAVHGSVLSGEAFSCQVDTGCNGMSAIALLVAGLASFPSPWRHRLLGLVILLPVLLVNVVRIAGLYWTGAHAPSFFGPSHVYVGQVVVIVVTAGLWWGWLSWSYRRRAESS